jgi:hypothetical protein
MPALNPAEADIAVQPFGVRSDAADFFRRGGGRGSDCGYGKQAAEHFRLIALHCFSVF